jgi:hypothetical protein
MYGLRNLGNGKDIVWRRKALTFVEYVSRGVI